LHGEAQRIRDEVEQESAQVARREALADETAAKARAAKAEAEAKAAEAIRLEQRAESHRSSVETSRDELDQRRAHADTIDPHVKVDENADENADDVVDGEVVDPQDGASYDRTERYARTDTYDGTDSYDRTGTTAVPPAAHRG
jgi:hypothetical protein